MNLFTAAVYTNAYKPGMKLYEDLTDREKDAVNSSKHILESYHYVKKQQFVDAMRDNGAKVFLDSGAFSAFTLGTKINIDEYCDYINRNRDIIRVEDGALMAAVLDGIGDAQETYLNQMYMEHRGIKPMPCFHVGEDERYLEWYIERYDYISLGGLVGRSTKQQALWLDRVWSNYLVDGSGNPKIKVHGFGLTSYPMMQDYPWYSVDSSSWIQATSFGVVVVPEFGPVRVSTESPSRHVEGQHLCNMTDLERERIIKTIEGSGFDLDRLGCVYQSRAAYNVWAYCQMNNMINEYKKDHTFSPTKMELF